MIKAIVFDMDGVLIDAKEWHYEALNRALQHFGYGINRYDHLVTFDGLPTSKKLELLSREYGLPVELHELINALKQKYTLELVFSQCKPFFQHEYALAKLKSSGYLLGLASNSIRQTVDVMMNKANLTRYFDVILSNQDVALPKPNPEIYLTAAERLGVVPELCLVIEDNDHGIAAARAAGTRVMVVKSVVDVSWENILRNLFSVEGEEP